jgi:hypothetical protein
LRRQRNKYQTERHSHEKIHVPPPEKEIGQKKKKSDSGAIITVEKCPGEQECAETEKENIYNAEYAAGNGDRYDRRQKRDEKLAGYIGSGFNSQFIVRSEQLRVRNNLSFKEMVRIILKRGVSVENEQCGEQKRNAQVPDQPGGTR